ncbi:MAG TPA: glycosyltransferase family 39 protein, partial [Candidatus Polarisedimenticolia bacterium]|nr:glycosyltransferase family 39 protein [Candidatus Polarisedimenticolia bacterium]
MTARGSTGSEAPGSRPSAVPVLILGALIVVAVVLRFFRLGDWNFEGTEMFTLRDSVRPQWHNARPLGYLLNYYLVRPFRPLDELGLRLVPAIAGVLAVPAFYAVARRLVGVRPALFGALLVTLSGLQVFYSQFARYWSLVFLFCAIYPYALYIGVRDRSGWALAVGLVTLALAALAHPVAVVLVGGPLLWLAAVYLRPRYLRQAWTYPSFRWALAGVGVLLVLLAIRFVPLLRDWIVLH